MSSDTEDTIQTTDEMYGLLSPGDKAYVDHAMALAHRKEHREALESFTSDSQQIEEGMFQCTDNDHFRQFVIKHLKKRQESLVRHLYTELGPHPDYKVVGQIMELSCAEGYERAIEAFVAKFCKGAPPASDLLREFLRGCTDSRISFKEGMIRYLHDSAKTDLDKMWAEFSLQDKGIIDRSWMLGRGWKYNEAVKLFYIDLGFPYEKAMEIGKNLDTPLRVYATYPAVFRQGLIRFLHNYRKPKDQQSMEWFQDSPPRIGKY